MTNTAIITKVEALIESSDSNVVTAVVNLVVPQLLLRLGLDSSDEVPDELCYVAVNVSLARYNQLGDEGKSSMTVEGESAAWLADLFAPYAADIQAYLDKENSTTGGVRIKFL